MMMAISIVLISLGLFFMIVSTVGLIQFPGLYTRAHAVAKSETLGLLMVLVGLLFQPDIDIGSAARLVLILAFSMAANPTAVHALLRAARRAGVQPWKTDDELLDEQPDIDSTSPPDAGTNPGPHHDSTSTQPAANEEWREA